MRIFTNAHYDFIRWRWHAIALSLVIILAGFGLMAQRGVPLGIDFSGGTIVILKFQKATSENDVRRALDSVPGEEVIQAYGDPAQNQILVRLPLMEGAEQGASLEEGAKRVVAAVKAANLGQFEVVNQELVGPVVGADLQRKGIYATLASILGITGYSVNDTIVIFDRVRENSHLLRRESLVKIVNDSVNQTLSRTVITAGTTFLACLSLFLFGGEVLNGFAFTMLVGIVSGTYSTIFIAAAVAIILSKAAPVRTAPAAAPTPEGGSKTRRKAKAS
jgi:preprotein translocase subunit SecF